MVGTYGAGMSISEHPPKGTILLCDFNSGFVPPEMVKHRPVVVLSPRIKGRGKLCTVVALSTTAPNNVMPYHAHIALPKTFPVWMRESPTWVKGDMLYSVSFMRLDFIKNGKDNLGKRVYCMSTLDAENMRLVEESVLKGLGLGILTKHL